ncbi:hypothetical protein [Streptomyces rimosus]|uniref:hypothetical protein n=1 Tax=Streptomyces rimosus TaxID=1927 RepID=UPI0037CF97EF
MVGQIDEWRQRRMRLLYDHHQEEEKRRVALGSELRKIEREVIRYVSDERVMPCLVRRSLGAQRTVYHAADAPCGYVVNPNNFMRMCESEARDADGYRCLERCGSCRWPQALKHHARWLLDNSCSD